MAPHPNAITSTTSTASAVRHGFSTFLVIWAGQLLARLGNGLTAFALSVHVYQVTGQSTAVALIALAAFLPALLLGPIAGALADRFDRRLLMILADVMSMLCLVGLVAAFSTGLATMPVLCCLVAVQSAFSALLDPAYRATVTDLLGPEQYARAAGLVQVAAAVQFVISPALAGLLMAGIGIAHTLEVDLALTVVTVVCMLGVWRRMKAPRMPVNESLWSDLRLGIRYFAQNRAILILMLLVTLMTFCMGFLQTLFTPLLLDLANEQTLGFVRSGAAIGMLVSSIVIGVRSMGTRHITYLAVALAVGGLTISAMGATTSVLWIAVFAFVYFLTLPPMNTSIEVLARAWIPNAMQGRIWGLMGLLSQFGFLLAYAASGPLADLVFTPALQPDGALAATVGRLIGTGPSRGIGFMFVLVGLATIVTAALTLWEPHIKVLERHFAAQAAGPAPCDEPPAEG